MSLLPRWMHHVYANFYGYFWLPCPLCHDFRGQEAELNAYYITHWMPVPQPPEIQP